MPDLMGRGVAVPISVADGGTGATSASGARSALSLFGDAIPVIQAYSLNAGNQIGIGQAAPTGQGSSVVNTIADGVRWDQRSTGTNQGGQAGVYLTTGSNAAFDTGIDWTLWLQFRTDSDLTNYCIYMGATSSQQSLSTDSVTTNTILARYRQGLDTKFTAFGRGAGAASSGAAFGPNVSVSTSYTMRIRYVVADAKAYFGLQAGLDLFGMFGTEAEVTTLPASGTSLGWQCQGGAFTAGTARNFLWHRMVGKVGAA